MQILGYTNGQKKALHERGGKKLYSTFKRRYVHKELKAIELGLELSTFDLFSRFDMKFRKISDSSTSDEIRSSKTLVNPEVFPNQSRF